MNILKHRYVCQFCEKSFAREDRYIAHQCKQRKRDEEIKTPIGQSAWQYYQDWMHSHKRAAPSIETFLSSRYYISFIKFAKFVQSVKLPDVKTFIWLMKEKDLSPTIWTSNQVYVNYIEYLDRKATPLQQVNITVNTLLELAEKYNTNTGNLFNVIHPNEVINLVRERRLSPWVLLCSGQFKQFYEKRTNPEQRIILTSLIRAGYWPEKFKKYPEEIEKIKKIVKELEI